MNWTPMIYWILFYWKGLTGEKGSIGEIGPIGVEGPKGGQGDKGDRGYTTTLNNDQFPTGIIEGPPGPPGVAGELH